MSATIEVGLSIPPRREDRETYRRACSLGSGHTAWSPNLSSRRSRETMTKNARHAPRRTEHFLRRWSMRVEPRPIPRGRRRGGGRATTASFASFNCLRGLFRYFLACLRMLRTASSQLRALLQRIFRPVCWCDLIKGSVQKALNMQKALEALDTFNHNNNKNNQTFNETRLRLERSKRQEEVQKSKRKAKNQTTLSRPAPLSSYCYIPYA